MRLRLKLVPDNDPNAPGHWIDMNGGKPLSAVGLALYRRMHDREKWDLYNSNAPPGYHVVMITECP